MKKKLKAEHLEYFFGTPSINLGGMKFYLILNDKIIDS